MPVQTSSSALSPARVQLPQRRRIGLSDFQVLPARFRSTQKRHLNWLAAAHAQSGGVSMEEMKSLFRRYGASSPQIAFREHELEDFSHRRWDKMRLFGGGASDVRHKTAFYDEALDSIFDRFYPTSTVPPQTIVHVTCTGYSAPSGAQRLVSARGWGKKTQVLHAYHMGCYAAHPAVRMAAGLGQSVDIVHTELCSLHLDLSNREPSQLIIQSLFADGFIKYQVKPLITLEGHSLPFAALEVLAARDVIIPDSTEVMRWATGPLVYEMELSKDVPILLASALPRTMVSLCEEAGHHFEREKEKAVFAIHPGGPRIIDLLERILRLRPDQTRWSREVLRDHGNMSSATLPYIWKKILDDSSVADGTLVMSIGAGPGLTLSGALFRKRSPL